MKLSHCKLLRKQQLKLLEYFVLEVTVLSKSAFNAMLKTLEEPPAHVKFILATTDPQKVPVTVLSRCLQFNLRQMAGTSITSHLQNILAQENIAYESAALHLISRAAAGSMRDALSLTDQAIAYGGQTVNETEVRAMLGAIDQSYLYQLIDALVANDGPSLIAQAKVMEERSLSFEVAFNDLAQLLHQIAVAQTVPESIAHDLPEHQRLLTLAQQLPAETLQLYYQIALLGRRDISLAPDEFAGFTMSLMRMLAFTPNQGNARTHPTSPATLQPAEKAVLVSSADPTPLSNSTFLAEKKTELIAELPQAEIAKPIETPQENSHQTFNGNWRGLIDQLKLGLARTLALHCELVSYDENSMIFNVPETQKSLLSLNYQEKLTAAISQFYDRKIKLQFNVGGSGNNVAKQVSHEKATAQANAVNAIEEDSFVQALIQDFDAEIIPNSIKPIQ